MENQRDKLIKAEKVASTLFETVVQRGLIVPGKSEKELNDEVYKLAKELFNIKRHWHKRIVRCGANTLLPYKENPPNLVIQEDDILFFDFGPVIDKWEADYGRTYVIGNDPIKHKLKKDIELAWYEGYEWFKTKKKVASSELFNFISSLAGKYGWTYGGEIAGHLIGKFPHEKIEAEKYELYIHPDNHNDMFLPDENGNKREWILEIHFIDKEKEIGGFFEQLLRS